MGILYAENGKIYCKEYMEIYVPLDYFDANHTFAVNNGSSIETFGVVFTRAFPKGQEGPIQLFNVPVIIDLMIYEFKYETISVHHRNIDVMTLQYPKGSYILHQTVTRGREVAEAYLSSVLNGKLPRVLNYNKPLNLWWRNLEISGVSFKVPSDVYEMIIATIYRNPKNPKERYGQYYGKQSNPNGYDYQTDNVRAVVKNLSTFSGMVFEDMSKMITSGINNSLDEIEEPISPLEKIIHY